MIDPLSIFLYADSAHRRAWPYVRTLASSNSQSFRFSFRPSTASRLPFWASEDGTDEGRDVGLPNIATTIATMQNTEEADPFIRQRQFENAGGSPVPFLLRSERKGELRI